MDFDDEDESPSPLKKSLGHELHKDWVAGGKRKEDVAPLLGVFKPIIARKAQEISKGAKLVNPAALEGHLTALAVDAFHSWDPDHPSGATLQTHVINNLRPALRKVIQWQNVARIPEEDALRIGQVGRAEAALSDQFGRPPTLGEIAKEVGISEKQVGRVKKRQIADVSSGAFEVDPLGVHAGRDLEIAPLLREHLTPRQQQVFDLVYHPTAPVRSTGEIARRLGLKDWEVSDAKTQIAVTWKRYT